MQIVCTIASTLAKSIESSPRALKDQNLPKMAELISISDIIHACVMHTSATGVGLDGTETREDPRILAEPRLAPSR